MTDEEIKEIDFILNKYGLDKSYFIFAEEVRKQAQTKVLDDLEREYAHLKGYQSVKLQLNCNIILNVIERYRNQLKGK